MSKETSIRVRCGEDTQLEFKRFAAAYDDYEDALTALLDAHRNNAEMTRRRNF
ncbi:MAG: hypothetical protein ACOCUO_01530 [archaeon]